MKETSPDIIPFKSPAPSRGTNRSQPPSFTFVGPSAATKHDRVFFQRPEFEAILNLYGKMVASGHWKDYAIDSTSSDASFAIYQHAHDRPLYIIRKTPKLAARQGAYSLISAQGKILKRGADLDRLLSYFNKALIKLIR
ncbi:DUF2794 domain-containing protein [Paremcibacter congregatus]|uniref:DUF2794 domain-containing protein n=1 Tax=Paremcibacter congregatus TaxID=2043170 RepID=UPI0030EF97F7|tara:strand:+ start:911 stop:1327 length:417 start_codon:yes stop_codon:yes gene_type:complete